ncbi:hypothetical protein FH609_016730 [Streptomyces sp. 3MP-14]|uniref:PIN domain-containing protein n=1 Tax=Streptomyces mimosae TaxID=2586635 RepID=A0A5N6A8T0_9ACTN|nr:MULTISPECIES: hypothetical protein [Streptomyces]KAB8165224.1 hypothetical protein FH607_014055 [Streptomyces mimosae]KAB8175856.1 hypothetical protein FH609_016730 [Streptomyces sp. 3MP-14]
MIGYERLIASVDLPAPDDRRVLAAAIRSRAQAIVTFDSAHCPAGHPSAWGTVGDVPDGLERDGPVAATAALRAMEP